MFQRDPRDRRFPERLAGSYIASILLHILGALLLFALASSSSEEGATESAVGGQIVTMEHAVAQVKPVAQPSAQPPVPHASIAPVPRRAPVPVPAAQRQPQNRPELSKIVAKASPLPKPVPQSSLPPNPQPTQPVVEPSPAPQIPAVPVNVATAAAVAISIKTPPTAVPSPAVTSAPTARPSAKPQPSAVPTHTPATPAPAVAASAVPKPAAAVARATAAPATPAPPGPAASVAPAKVAGVPSPSPTKGSAVANTVGTAPSPGPKGLSSPGPRPGNAGITKGPQRPIAVRPSPAPSRPAAGSGGQKQTAINNELNNLRNLLPSGPTNVVSRGFSNGYNSIGTQMDPTPPPDVLAQTKYLYETSGGAEARTKMWVTSLRREGPVTICSGWLVRWPVPPTVGGSGGDRSSVTVLGGHSRGVLAVGNTGGFPIIEAHATYVCGGRALRPFTPP
jgi:hypothetical protein